MISDRTHDPETDDKKEVKIEKFFLLESVIMLAVSMLQYAFVFWQSAQVVHSSYDEHCCGQLGNY